MVRTISYTLIAAIVSSSIGSNGARAEAEPATQAAKSGIPALVLRWTGSKTTSCQKLIETFLNELRLIAPDRIVQLDVAEDNSQQTTESVVLKIKCGGGGTTTEGPMIIEIADDASIHQLHYIARTSSFDSLDWIPFQQRYLRPTQSNAATTTTAGKSTEKLTSLSQLSAPEKSDDLGAERFGASHTDDSSSHHGSVFQQWWLWAAVAATAGGALALIRSQSGGSRVSVEIH